MNLITTTEHAKTTKQKTEIDTHKTTGKKKKEEDQNMKDQIQI